MTEAQYHHIYSILLLEKIPLEAQSTPATASGRWPRKRP